MAIHKFHDRDLWEKIQRGEVSFVSPSVFPINATLRHTDNGHYTDASDWEGLHLAYVDDPAYDQKANITHTCQGESCQGALLKASEGQANSENLDNIQQVRLHTKSNLKKSTKKCKDVNLKEKLEATEMNILLSKIDRHHKPQLFKPKKGEDPDEGDFYWRTLPDGRKMRFRADEDMTKKLKRWQETRKKSKKPDKK